MKKLVMIISIAALTAGSAFAQQKDIAKIYTQLDSLENRKLELRRENDKAILDCLEYQWWMNSSKATACRMSYAGIMNGVDWKKATEYRNEICECSFGKKHEIEVVETQIKQLERRIDLLKDGNKKDIAKIYTQLDSLENGKLELKREKNKTILDCLEYQWWMNSREVTGCRVSYAGIMNGVDWKKATEYRNEICECYGGKKHEIEAVEAQIKQLERRIDLLKYSDKSTQPVKK
jgi:tetrahydrodipicolinate N-succinyltransferase